MSQVINIKADYGDRIQALWDNPAFQDQEVIERGYMVAEEIFSNRLLFIGINPSYDGKPNSRIEESYYKIDTEGEQTHPYFKKIKEVADKVKMPWTHLDLLFFRGDQHEINTSILKGRKEADFLNAQLNITCEILERTQPKIIVVANTKARAYLGKGISIDWVAGRYQFRFHQGLGTDILEHSNPNNDLHGTPVFFTSMLSGQRALDSGSLERLVWHITKVNRFMS